MTKSGIRVVSYVQTEDGLVDFDGLTPEQRTRCATELKARYLNEMFRGRAAFEAGEITEKVNWPKSTDSHVGGGAASSE